MVLLGYRAGFPHLVTETAFDPFRDADWNRYDALVRGEHDEATEVHCGFGRCGRIPACRTRAADKCAGGRPSQFSVSGPGDEEPYCGIPSRSVRTAIRRRPEC